MPTQRINSRIYNPGERNVDIPDGLARRFNFCKADFTRESWPAGVDYTLPSGSTISNAALAVFAEQSSDGLVWEPLGSAVFPGGVISDPRTGEITVSSVSFAWDGSPKEGSVRLRVVNTVTLRTEITATVLDRSV